MRLEETRRARSLVDWRREMCFWYLQANASNVLTANWKGENSGSAELQPSVCPWCYSVLSITWILHSAVNRKDILCWSLNDT